MRIFLKMAPVLGFSLVTAAFAQTQKVPIASCTSNPAPVSGYECGKAYDGNSGTTWRVRALPSTTQEIRLNFSSPRRVKRIVATWDVAPTGYRDYFYLDSSNALRWIGSRIGSQTTDDLPLDWGSNDETQDTWAKGQTFLVYVASTAAAGLREVVFHGPGLYREPQILTRRIPIPPWDMNAEASKPFSIGTPIPANRIVGASAFVYSDGNMIHNLASLSVYPIQAYTYAMGPGNVGFPPGFSFSATQAPNTDIDWVFLTSNPGYHGNSDFDDPNKNPRGWLTIKYLSQAPEFP